MNKKGVTMSMNVIIAAVIALLILVVLSILIMNRVGIFGRGTGCEGTQGGRCVSNTTSCSQVTDSDGDPMVPSPLACPEGQRCCMPSPV